MEDEWVPLTSLIVKYPKGDHFGKFLAFVSLAPFIIITAYLTLIFMIRDVRVVFMFIGQLLNEVVALIMKYSFRHPRPPHGEVYLRIYGKADHGYGFPSQHSQFQAYFAVFSILYLSSLRFDSRGARLFANFIKLFLVGICALVILSRVYLVYHYLYQCLWGAAFGTLFAFFWYQISERIMEPFAYKRILSWRISKLLHLTWGDNGLVGKKTN